MRTPTVTSRPLDRLACKVRQQVPLLVMVRIPTHNSHRLGRLAMVRIPMGSSHRLERHRCKVMAPTRSSRCLEVHRCRGRRPEVRRCRGHLVMVSTHSTHHLAMVRTPTVSSRQQVHRLALRHLAMVPIPMVNSLPLGLLGLLSSRPLLTPLVRQMVPLLAEVRLAHRRSLRALAVLLRATPQPIPPLLRT